MIFLQQQDVPGISEIDTRAVTRHIRQAGTMRAALVNKITEKTVAELQQPLDGSSLIATSATHNAYPVPATGRRIAVLDFGLKYSILRELTKRNCDVMVLPPTASLEEIHAVHPDGILLTNGPGDPQDIPHQTLALIRQLEEQYPLFGICMGHQLFALANGATIVKMKFGHRGFNHPVRNLETGRIDFTSQNHGYMVDRASVAATKLTILLEEINDHCVEGYVTRRSRLFLPSFIRMLRQVHMIPTIFLINLWISLIAIQCITKKGEW